jgi:BASS family bile acid:Na+ symporter
MFGVALGIKLDTFKDILRNPKSVLTGLVLQWVALPAATCLLVIILNPFITPMVAIGMILVACCPGGNISNFISSLSKGNAELSVFMTAITTLFATLITPFNFWLWGTLYCRFAAVKNDIPTLEIPFMDMLSQILLILGLPIVLGVIVSRYLPNLSKRLAKPAQILSILLFICMVVASVAQVLSGFERGWTVYACLLAALVVVILHNATALSTGYFGATVMHLPRIDRRSITIEVGIQNSGLGLALLLNPNIFAPEVWSHNGGMVVVVALWGVWHIISGLSIATVFRRKPLCE